MNVNMDYLMDSLVVMGKGMGGIFFVLIIIALIVALLAKITNIKKK